MNQDETMLTMGIDEMTQAVSGHVFGVTEHGVRATSVTTDSRQVRPGSVFVAIAGERVDGHDFVAKAATEGAVAAVVEHVVPDTAIAQIVVDNSVQALWLFLQILMVLDVFKKVKPEFIEPQIHDGNAR